ncbi:MAG: histidine kinase [Bacteroidota bacterium]
MLSIVFLFIFSFFAEDTLQVGEEDKQEGSAIAISYLQKAERAIGISPDSLTFYARKAFGLARIESQDSIKWKSALLLAQGFVEVRRLDSAKRYYQMVLDSQTDTTFLLSKATNGLGMLALLAEDDYKALSYYLASLEMDEKLGNEKDLPKAYYNVSTILHRFGRKEEALEYAKKTLLSSRAQDLLEVELHALVGLANQFYRSQQFYSALFYGGQAFQKGQMQEHEIAQLMSSAILSPSYILNAQFKEGLQFANIAFQYAEKYRMSGLLDLARVNRAYAYNGLGFYQKAIAELDLIEGSKDTRDVHEALGQAYAGLNQARKSHYHQRRFRHLVDSSHNRDLSSKVAELQTQYETEKKDQEIKNLTQLATIQNLKLDQRKNQILIGGLVFSIVFIIGYLLYRNYRVKKEQVAAELEQRFLRSQLNPHFIFNSMTAIQNYLYSHQDMEQAGHYMGMFSTLMRQILENSREEYIPIGEEVKMLRNYLELQKIRFSESFSYDIQLDDDLDEEYSGIPPMFAQPFVENALEHGLFREKGRKNHLAIHFKRVDHRLISVEVIDSGKGIRREESKVNHKSLATRIIQERLDSFGVAFKEKVGIVSENIVNKSGTAEGYRVHLTLPSQLIAPSL